MRSSAKKRYHSMCAVKLPLMDILYSGYISLHRTKCRKIEFALCVILFSSPKSEHLAILYSGQIFAVPSTWTVQNSLSNADAGRSLTQYCPAPLIDSPTGHYTNTGTHSSLVWLSFLAILQQGRALEHTFVVLNNMSMHYHTY